MVLRYWKNKGLALVKKDVDRVLFKSIDDLQFRYVLSGRYEWVSLKYGVDYLEFALSM